MTARSGTGSPGRQRRRRPPWIAKLNVVAIPGPGLLVVGRSHTGQRADTLEQAS
jgi:hypothetical protein